MLVRTVETAVGNVLPGPFAYQVTPMPRRIVRVLTYNIPK